MRSTACRPWARARSWSRDKKIAWPAQLAIGGDGMGNSLDHIREIMGTSMEALIHHFKLVTEGFRVPAGQVYQARRVARAASSACHLVSDGGTRPYRAHFRDPSFNNLQAVAAMCEGGQVADVIVAVASHRPRHGRRGPLMATLDLTQAASSGCARRRARAIIARYPQKRSALLPLLHLVQCDDGYVSPRGIAFCADILDLTTAEVSAVATFYTQYKRHPNGEYTVGVCTNTLCAVMGGDEIWDALSRAPRRRPRRDDRRRQDHPRARRVQRGVRLRARRDGQLGVLRQPDARPARASSSTTCAPGTTVAPTRGANTVCTFKQVSRVLAGFHDGRADEGVGAGTPSLRGTRARPAEGLDGADAGRARPSPRAGRSPQRTPTARRARPAPVAPTAAAPAARPTAPVTRAGKPPAETTAGEGDRAAEPHRDAPTTARRATPGKED